MVTQVSIFDPSIARVLSTYIVCRLSRRALSMTCWRGNQIYKTPRMHRIDSAAVVFAACKLWFTTSWPRSPNTKKHCVEPSVCSCAYEKTFGDYIIQQGIDPYPHYCIHHLQYCCSSLALLVDDRLGPVPGHFLRKSYCGCAEDHGDDMPMWYTGMDTRTQTWVLARR